MSLLTEDGLLAVPTTSKEEDALMEIEPLISDHGDLFSDNLAVSGESSKADKDTSGKDKHTREKGHKRKRSETVPLEEQLEQSEQAIKSLTRHLERKTCPKSLQYRARARIRAENEFRKDIKQLRSKAERNYVKALIRFHYRRIDSLRSALQKQKRIKNSTPNTNSTVTRKSAFARSAPSETVTAETVQKAEKTIEELQRIVELFNSNKKKRDYTCLLNDSHNTKRGSGHTKPSRVRNKTRKIRRKNNRIDRFDAQTEANKKTHQKPLERRTYK